MACQNIARPSPPGIDIPARNGYSGNYASSLGHRFSRPGSRDTDGSARILATTRWPDQSGKLRSRIGTVFPRSRTIVTLPGIHAMQRMAYLDLLAAERTAAGQPPMSREEESAEWEASVDLVFDDGDVLIRPDPENMPLAFEADEVLQEIIPKHRIKFLNVGNEKVRKAIERQGECWRIALLPRSLPEMIHMIAASKVAVAIARSTITTG